MTTLQKAIHQLTWVKADHTIPEEGKVGLANAIILLQVLIPEEKRMIEGILKNTKKLLQKNIEALELDNNFNGHYHNGAAIMKEMVLSLLKSIDLSA